MSPDMPNFVVQAMARRPGSWGSQRMGCVEFFQHPPIPRAHLQIKVASTPRPPVGTQICVPG